MSLKRAVYQEVAYYHPESVPLLDRLYQEAEREAQASLHPYMLARQQQLEQQQAQQAEQEWAQTQQQLAAEDMFIPDF